MRTISKRTQYGLKAILALGSRFGEGPVLISTLSKEESIPIKFLELILLDLKSHGLLESKKGKGGGYLLTRPPSTLTIGSLLRILEGSWRVPWRRCPALARLPIGHARSVSTWRVAARASS